MAAHANSVPQPRQPIHKDKHSVFTVTALSHTRTPQARTARHPPHQPHATTVFTDSSPTRRGPTRSYSRRAQAHTSHSARAVFSLSSVSLPQLCLHTVLATLVHPHAAVRYQPSALSTLWLCRRHSTGTGRARTMYPAATRRRTADERTCGVRHEGRLGRCVAAAASHRVTSLPTRRLSPWRDSH